MDKVPPITNTRPVVNVDGVLTQEARTSFNELYRRAIISGNGPPEGVVSATQSATYYDLSATTGFIIYVKTKSDINGDNTLGWVLA